MTDTPQDSKTVLQQNKEIVARWVSEYWDAGDPSVVDELATEDIRVHYPLGGESRGREAVKNRIIGFKEMFPEGGFDITDELIAEGDRVAACYEGAGTHTGPAWELPMGTVPESSGRSVSYTGIAVYRVHHGKIASEYGEGDYLGMVQQLGLIDPPGE